MDIDLRLVLFLLGVVIIAVIVWDFYRKKSKATDKAEEFNQQALDDLMDQRDNSGFDLTGVGLSRIIGGDDSLLMDDGLTATRDEKHFVDDGSFGQAKPSDDSESSTTVSEPELIITFSIIASNEQGFTGEKLLHCMLSRGLRFGAMNIFHRHKHTSGEGPVQFSLANAINPGTFNLDDMSSFETKAVTLFMRLPGPKEPLKSYKLMLDTAQYIAKELKGQLVDGSRSVLTQQSIQHFHEQIQDFERRVLSKPTSP